MKANPKKICNSIERNLLFLINVMIQVEISKDSPYSINIFLKEDIKILNPNKKMKKTINITLKNSITKQLPEYLYKFDELYRNYYLTTVDSYKIKYNVIRFTTKNIYLKCPKNNSLLMPN